MTYCKVIQNNTVVSVGRVFLKWSTKKNMLFICDVDDGQFLQSYDEKHIYKADWFRPSPDAKCKFENATIEVITETEYEDIKALLEEGEPVIEEEHVAQEPVVKHEEQQEEEKPLSIAEMREIIKTQQEQIELLMSKIN